MKIKNILLAVIFLAAAFVIYQKTKPLPPPPPPPPPPAPIHVEAPPVVDAAQLQKVLKSVNDDDPEVRWQALAFLGKIRSPQARPLLFEKLLKDPNKDLRIKIIQLLATMQGPDISQRLVWALKDTAAEVRVASLVALDQVDDDATVPAITSALKDESSQVRLQALTTLNDLQEKKAKRVQAEADAEQKRQYDLEVQRQAEEAKAKEEEAKKHWFHF